MAIEIVDLPIKHGGSVHCFLMCFVCLPERGTQKVAPPNYVGLEPHGISQAGPKGQPLSQMLVCAVRENQDKSHLKCLAT